MALYDMHCHLDFLSDAAGDAPETSEVEGAATGDAPKASVVEGTTAGEPEIARTTHAARADRAPAGLAHEGGLRGMRAFSSTVTPEGYLCAVRLLGACGNVRVGVGMHPWWVADGSVCEEEIRLFERLAADSRFIGEVGLDFASRWAEARDAQVAAFARALDACAGGGKVVSIHAVRSASTVLDMLEARGSCKGNACILHWFSGASDELARAVRLGCYFSVGPRMMETKRGRAYVCSIPVGRLLLETDMPAGEGASYSADEWERDMRGVLAAVAEARREDSEELGASIARTSARLLGWCADECEDSAG